MFAKYSDTSRAFFYRGWPLTSPSSPSPVGGWRPIFRGTQVVSESLTLGWFSAL
jgi:hypothetical protein